MNQPSIAGIAPFFIVRDVRVALSFYSEKLGFEAVFKEPAHDPFFAIVQRDGAMIFLKAVNADPVPNRKRAADARWDAYVGTPDPDKLAAEFISRGTVFTSPLQDTHDGLRGFELEDADGYLLFFGRPR
ncbi:VOC family protein [Mucilaginibacter sp.]|uniref:VOC family protein n=1 Tax=Mucilaginibacter sp. TaxID=1882438 RepID=UPI002ED4A274